MGAAMPQNTNLRKNLSLWQAVGLSVALMAPSMAANINPQGTAATVGRAVPLTFVVATVGVLLVAYVFVRLCQAYNHAGSVYGFVGATLGPRVGVVAGWSLLGTYCFYGVVTSTAAGRFASAFLDEIGWWNHPPDWAAMMFAAIALVGVYLLTVAPARRSTGVLLSVEGATVALILVISVVVLSKVIAGSTPSGQSFTLQGFSVPHGTGLSTVFLGVVFGFLSFAGFEASSTLGEEAREPRRDIPRAILGTAIFGGVYFVFVTAIEVMGFGANPAGVKAFVNSTSLMGDLGTTYVASWVGELVTIGAGVSAFGCALACAVGASRLLFALARDARGETGIGAVNRRTGTPAGAATVVVVAMYVIAWVMRLPFGADSFSVFVWSGTIGTLILLVAYVAATCGAIRLLFFSGPPRVRRWEIVIPLGALVVLGYTLYRNVVPYPTGAAKWFPITAGLWVLAGVAAVLAAPRIATRLGEQLERDDGLRGDIPGQRQASGARQPLT
jgi:amino acid transporter